MRAASRCAVKVAVVAAVVGAGVSSSCAPTGVPAGTIAAGGEGPGASAARAGALILDGPRGGTPGFYFLPPLVPRPANLGPEVPDLAPTVNIERRDAEGRYSESVAVFTPASGPFGERVRRHLTGGPAVDDDGDTDPDGYFVARWRTGLFPVAPGDFYRIRVSVSGRQLGFADVQVVGTRRQFREVDRDQFVPLVDGNVLRIKFRVDRPAVDRDGDGVFDWADNCLDAPNADQADTAGDGVGDACRCTVVDGAFGPAGRLYALTVDPQGVNDFFSPFPADIEVVDLDDGSTVRTIPAGNRAAARLEVSADGRRAYLPNRVGREITVVETVCGGVRATIAVPFVMDMALGPGGGHLYAAAIGGIFSIDTATNLVDGSFPLADVTTPLGLAVSPDGTTVAVATTDGGSRPAVELLDARHGLVPLATVSIVGDVEGCADFPNDVVFTGNDHLLAWDSNCDVVYQIDVAARTQVPEATVHTGRDSGSTFDFNHAFIYAPGIARALLFKESSELLSVNPVAGTFTVVTSYPELRQPFGLVLSPDGASTYVWIVNFDPEGVPIPNTLDRIDNATLLPALDVHLFPNPNRWVRSAQVVMRP